MSATYLSRESINALRVALRNVDKVQKKLQDEKEEANETLLNLLEESGDEIGKVLWDAGCES